MEPFVYWNHAWGTSPSLSSVSCVRTGSVTSPADDAKLSRPTVDRLLMKQVIMGFPALDHAFEKHVQDYLCSESYDFLKAVRAPYLRGYTQDFRTMRLLKDIAEM